MSNHLLKAVDKNREIRAYVIHATDVVAKACETHETWSSASVALGRTLLGTVLLAANLKGSDRLSVVIKGNGSGGSIVCECDAHANVRGYIQNPHVDMRKTSTGEVITTQATGNSGTFTVIKDMGLKHPYTGQIPFVTGEIGEEFTYYLTDSEQIPSSVGLNVYLDDEDRVRLGAGFLVQVLPGASEESILKIEKNIQEMPAISDILKEGNTETLFEHLLGKDNFDILEEMPVSLTCDCSKEKYSAGLATLQKEDLQLMIDEDHGAEVVCHFCKTKYQFSEEELKELL